MDAVLPAAVAGPLDHGESKVFAAIAGAMLCAGSVFDMREPETISGCALPNAQTRAK